MTSEGKQDVLIREYESKDRAKCLEIFESNRPDYFAEHEYQEFADWLDKPDCLTYSVVELIGEVVACGGLYLADDGQHVGMAWGMVHRDSHRNGLGRRLTEFRLEQMNEVYPRMEQRLATSQLTFGFYEKLGFKTVKVTENGFGSGIDRYDMVRKQTF
ncbi:GNAT family N-acetyltransferase [Planctomycetaceae bacterium SH139]